VCSNARIALLALAWIAGAGLAGPAPAAAQADSTSVAPAPADAGQPATPGAPAQSPPAAGNILNPNLSVIGWFQAEAGDLVDSGESDAFALREAEIGLQAAVDPYSRADFFIGVSPDEGASLEEGYLTLLALPAGLSAKLGKFRQNFGRFNRIHAAETPFADRPLAAERFLGEEGLAGMGASASWLAPLPFYLNLDAEVTGAPSRDEVPSFDSEGGGDLLYTARLGTFLELGEAANIALGWSYANGTNGAAYADSVDIPSSTPRHLRAQVQGLDVTFRWKNPRHAIYRSLVISAEAMQRSAETLAGGDYDSRGAFAYLDYQPVRRWHVGGRCDWSENLDLPGEHATGALAFLTFTPSEFALLSLQASHRELEQDPDETRYFFKTTFNIGPHGAHPF
jgi:hypothetical protein